MDLVDVPVPDGTAEAYVARPPTGSGPGVLFFMDAIGIRPRIAQMCDRIASWGYVVVAPHVFHREGSAAETAPSGNLMQPGAREAFFEVAMPRVHRLTPDLALPDIAAYVDFLRSLDGVEDGPIGTVGYCMGARLAVRAAGAHASDIAACGGFHGGGLATDDPASPHHALATARAEFVFGHADQDPSMPPEAIALLDDTLDAHDLSAISEVYPDAPHGYSMSDTPMYQEAATERHFTELEALFGRTL